MPEILSDKRIAEMLSDRKAIITDSHVVYTSGMHGSAYVNKDALYPHTGEISALCRTLMNRLAIGLGRSSATPWIPQAVAAPAVGGVTLAQRVAEHFSNYWGVWSDVPAVYAEREERKVRPSRDVAAELGIRDDEEAVIRTPRFAIKRDQAKYIKGKDVLVVEDVLNTGGSATRTVEAVRTAGGDVIAVGALCNRGGVTTERLGVPHLVSLVNVTMDAWPEEDCPLCKAGVPVNTEVGHGAAFVARTGR